MYKISENILSVLSFIVPQVYFFIVLNILSKELSYHLINQFIGQYVKLLSI